MGTDKKYDARIVSNYIEIVDSANIDYENKQARLLDCFSRYISNDTYLGREAEASKLFIAEGETKLLEETVNLHTDIKKLYLHAYDSFAEKVDASPNAKLSISALNNVSKDFHKFFIDTDECGRIIEEKISDLRSKYGKYGFITQPNYDRAREVYRDFCGGEDVESGFIADCVNRFILYDAEESNYINNSGIYERIEENTNRIHRISSSLDSAKVTAYELEKQIIYIDRVFSYDTGRFEYRHNEISHEQEIVINRIHSNLDLIRKSFNDRQSKDEDSKYVNSYRAGVDKLSIWGQKLDEFLCNKIDGLFNSATEKKIVVLDDGSLFGVTQLIGAIQSMVKYGNLSHTDEFSIENTNSFYKGALKKLTHITTGFLSMPKMVEDMGDLGLCYVVSMGNYLATHDPKTIPLSLDNYLREEIDTSNAQIKCDVKELGHKIRNIEVKDWFEVTGSASVDVALLAIGGKSDKKDIGKVNEPPKTLLQDEGKIGSYRDLLKHGKRGDNITPNHIPSAEYMVRKGIDKNDALCINMEMYSPGTGGRHRLTSTYGRNMTDLEKNIYYSLSPRDALVHDLKDLKRIYMDQGLYVDMRIQLEEYIKLCENTFPNMFGK